MIRIAFITTAALLPAAALAEGFRTKDFAALSFDPAWFEGGTYGAQTEPGRMVVACEDCPEMVLVDVRVGRSEDGTEARLRSGETTIADMLALCRENAAAEDETECLSLELAEAGGATGYVSEVLTPIGHISTYVLFQGGDMLTIRSLGSDLEGTRANADAAFLNIATQIVAP